MAFEECPCLRRYVHYSLSLSEGICVFNDKLDFAVAEVPSQCIEGHSIVSERAPSRLCAGYSMKVGDFLPATIAMTHPTNKSRRVM